jgi:hypothetical protein
MNDLQKEIQDLKAKVADLESRILFPNEPVAKWQPKGGEWYIGYGGGVVKLVTASESREFGLERQTKEQALRASIEMRRFNRLLALRDELCGDEDMDWGAYDEKYYVYLSHEDSKWDWTYDKDCQRIQPYFCSREEAQKACDMLNSGEVEL